MVCGAWLKGLVWSIHFVDSCDTGQNPREPSYGQDCSLPAPVDVTLSGQSSWGIQSSRGGMPLNGHTVNRLVASNQEYMIPLYVLAYRPAETWGHKPTSISQSYSASTVSSPCCDFLTAEVLAEAQQPLISRASSRVGAPWVRQKLSQLRCEPRKGQEVDPFAAVS